MKVKKPLHKASSILLLAFSVFITAKAQEIRPFSDINTPYNESHAVKSPNGDLYFSVGHHPENTGGSLDHGDIWISQPNLNGRWSKPLRIKALSTSGNDVVVGFPDASNILIYHDGQQIPQGIHLYTKIGNSWNYVKKLPISDFKTQSSQFSGRLSEDGKIIILSLQKEGGFGNEDLYVTFKKSDTEWSSPLNLGPMINTFGQEQTPYLSEDNSTIYFSSNFKANGRGKEIYFSRRLDDSWSNWSQPRELSKANSIGSESNYAKIFKEENIAVFTTTTNSEGMGDFMLISFENLVLEETDSLSFVEETIEQVISPQEVIAENGAMVLTIENLKKADTLSISNRHTVQQEILNSREEQISNYREDIVKSDPEKIVEQSSKKDSVSTEIMDNKVNRGEDLNKVQIMDKINKEPVEYLITIADEQVKKVLKNQDEMQEEWEKWNWNYIEISARGYIPNSLTVEEWQQLNNNTLEMVPAKAGARWVLKKIQFARSSAEFADEGTIQELDLLVNFMQENELVKIRLEGHTDNAGDPVLNKELSLARASKIRSYLTMKGIDFERIRITGWGGSKPIADNSTETGREINRRVEMYIER
ncbi:OmpA family protein [Cecembia rubra]|uniref:OmpA family protein n=1 Tax=Cecembia rubra TaxID=1485585 RepID=A0A2P8EDG9_9BACT|nr:OmpA family protein [Cecembia rubra]PSL07510.1 OmpA family protein [Cecembia rubra]